MTEEQSHFMARCERAQPPCGHVLGGRVIMVKPEKVLTLRCVRGCASRFTPETLDTLLARQAATRRAAAASQSPVTHDDASTSHDTTVPPPSPVLDGHLAFTQDEEGSTPPGGTGTAVSG